MKRGLPVLLLFVCSFVLAQNKKTDSLWSVYNSKAQPDTNKLKALHAIAWSLRNNNPDTAIILAEQELNLANSIPNENGKKWAANALYTISTSFYNKSNYPKSLAYSLKALKIHEEIGNKNRIGACYNIIGLVYFNQSNYTKALEYYFKQEKIFEETNNKQGLGACYGNIGVIYMAKSNYSKALEYYFKSLKQFEEIEDKDQTGICYGVIGDVYNYQSNYPKALAYYFKSLQLKKEIDDKQGIGVCYGNMSELYNKLANYKLSILYCDSELILCKETGDIDGERQAYKNLADVYAKINRYRDAYESHVKFKQLTDSIFNKENSTQLGDLKTKFEVEKKEAELKVKSEAEQEKLKAVSTEEKKRQQVIIFAVAGVLLIVISFSLFLLKRFRITQRQKNIIEKQKVMVDMAYEKLHEKNKEVMDSINYASRIQRALITSEKYITNQLNRLLK